MSIAAQIGKPAPGKPSRIHVLLPADRTRPGHLRVEDDRGGLLLQIPCLGKSSNLEAVLAGNPARDPLRRLGDTPTGEYAPARLIRYAGRHARFGAGVLPLQPIAGPALDAFRNGRRGLLIHGGRGDGRLVPTLGCIRLRDRDFARLARTLGDALVSIVIRDDMPKGTSVGYA